MCPFWQNMASWAEKPHGFSHELPQYIIIIIIIIIIVIIIIILK